jgi:succinyl-diaminopimelate desuccinylase
VESSKTLYFNFFFIKRYNEREDLHRKGLKKVKNIDWVQEVESRKNELIEDTRELLKIKSVLEEGTEKAPFGEGIAEALHFLLETGNKDGFVTKNVDGYAGHIEHGSGEELIGVLCHIDVVPEGDGWSVPPFGAVVKDGRIYARGAIDDKGPTMAAYYAIKILKELELPLSKRIRMIIGTDEESNWRCVDHYFSHEEMPGIGFAPDADFPIIHAEKGIMDFDLIQKKDEKGDKVLKSLTSGQRYNMVPDYAEALLTLENFEEESFHTFLEGENLSGHVTIKGEEVLLTIEGISAHGSMPEQGINAGIKMCEFLSTLTLDEKANEFVQYGAQMFCGDYYGEKLGIAYKDEVSGPLTVNIGLIRYKEDEEGKFGLNIRYPVTQQSSTIIEGIDQKTFLIENIDDSPPHHVEKDHQLIQTLQRVYEERTGEEATLLAIGGGTYARALKAGVAFGPLFQGREDVAHKKDEYMDIEDLLKATAIYAQALYELAK